MLHTQSNVLRSSISYTNFIQNHQGEKMSLFEKYTKAWNEKDITAFVECHHDDYGLVIQLMGEVKKMEDIDWDQMMEWMLLQT